MMADFIAKVTICMYLIHVGNPVCEEGLGVLHLCQLINQQVLFTHELFVNGSYFSHPCELLRDDRLVPCNINSNHCNFRISSMNISSSYSLQCVICRDNIVVKTGKFYFNFHSLPPCTGKC